MPTITNMTTEEYRKLIPDTSPWVDNDGKQTQIFKVRCDYCESKKKICERDTKSVGDVCVACKKQKRKCLRKGINVADAQRSAARAELKEQGSTPSGSGPVAPATPGPKKRKKAVEKDDSTADGDNDSGQKHGEPTPKKRRKATTPAPEAPPVNPQLREKPKSTAVEKPKLTAATATLKKQQTAAQKAAALAIAKEKAQQEAHQANGGGDGDNSSTFSVTTTATKKKTPPRAKPVSKAASKATKSAAVISDSEEERQSSRTDEGDDDDEEEDDEDEDEDTSQSATTAPTTQDPAASDAKANQFTSTATASKKKAKAMPEKYDPIDCISTVVAQIKDFAAPTKSLLIALSQDVEDQTSPMMNSVAELVKEMNAVSTRVIALKQQLSQMATPTPV